MVGGGEQEKTPECKQLFAVNLWDLSCSAPWGGVPVVLWRTVYISGN